MKITRKEKPYNLELRVVMAVWMGASRLDEPTGKVSAFSTCFNKTDHQNRKKSYILEPRVVIAVWMRASRLDESTGKVSAIFSKCFTAHCAASSKPSAIRIGWIPLSSNISACSRSAPANTA
jgi:hypothetical protein